MLNDLAIGHDHQADFESYVKADSSRSTGKLDFSVQVLTTGYWPTYKTMDVNLPPSMVKCTFQVDHIIGVAEGGGCCYLDNLRALCHACHVKKTTEDRDAR